MKAFIILLLSLLVFSPDVVAQKSTPEKTAKEIKAINFRKELKDRQSARKKRAQKRKRETEKAQKDTEKQQREKEAEVAETKKKALERHMKFQQADVRRRIEKNKKKSSQKFWD